MITDEPQLRERAMAEPAEAEVLADIYERDNQLERARLWRMFARGRLAGYDHSEGVAPDLYARIRTAFQKVDPRRGAMMWLLRVGLPARWGTYRNIGAWFGVSAERVKLYQNTATRVIRYAAFMERKNPTMRQTQRLEAAGALRGDVEKIDFDALPPDDWPRQSSWIRMRTERGWIAYNPRAPERWVRPGAG